VRLSEAHNRKSRRFSILVLRAQDVLEAPPPWHWGVTDPLETHYRPHMLSYQIWSRYVKPFGGDRGPQNLVSHAPRDGRPVRNNMLLLDLCYHAKFGHSTS